jgi:hypothetical protein
VRFDKKFAVAVAAFALAAGGLNAGLAHAESGRRICVYGEYGAGTGSQVWSDGWAVIDYKKNGDCPVVDYEKFFLAVGVPVPVSNQPVSKITCEELSGKLGWEPWPGADPCTKMEDDTVYRFQTTTDKNANTVEHSWPTFGKIWDYT